MSTELVDIFSKHQQIAADLRARIVDGSFGPGSQLPTFSDLEKEFGVARMTLRQALESLQSDGFVRSVERRGTFIVEKPPHLYRYAVVFPHHPESGAWHRLWTALTSEASRLDRESERQIGIYYCGRPSPEDPEYLSLLQEIERDRFAGVIFATVSKDVIQSPLYTANARLPRVVISPTVWTVATQAKSPLPEGFPYIETDNQALVVRALEWLKSRGRKRVAIICTPRMSGRMRWLENVAAMGMVTEPAWIHEIPTDWPPASQAITELLLRDNDAERRPDGLVIANDNFAEPACAGIVASGRKVGEQLDVVAHCNWPYPVPSVLPVKRLGFDAHKMLTWALDYIDGRRRGLKPETTYMARPLFENEVERSVG